jgi:hypothetical protein
MAMDIWCEALERRTLSEAYWRMLDKVVVLGV